MWGELALSFQQGNKYILVMIICTFFASILIFERIIMLQVVYNIDFQKFLQNFRKMITSNDYDRATNLCKSVSNTAFPRIALRAVEAYETDPTSVRGKIEEDTIDFLPKLEARLSHLPPIATIVMLIGILGTIDQLWWSFHSIDVLDTARKQASLAQGIAGSLNPTAMGILSCMLILASHQVLRSMALRTAEKVHHGLAVLHNLLVPADVATYVSAAPAMDMSMDDENLGESPQNDEGIDDDAFGDAAVEDIKDEEEII
ncbi:MAG: MotA/TolQ/ExbB proton channel family protein [Oligoflexales bacterium]